MGDSLIKNPSITRAGIASNLRLSIATTRREIKYLTDNKYIGREGRTRGKWLIFSHTL